MRIGCQHRDVAALFYVFLAIVAAFALIASVALVPTWWNEMRDELAAGGWRAVPGVTLRAILWLILGVMALYAVLLGGLFL